MFKISNNLDFKKISIKYSAVILILFPIFITIGFFTNFFLSILIYLLIMLTPVGIIGGIWLWEYLGSSDLFKKGLSIFPKIIGFFGVIALGIFTIASFYVSFNGNLTLLSQIVQMGTNLMWFMCWYFVGYLISIWRPKKKFLFTRKTKI